MSDFIKEDGAKPRTDLMPPLAILAVAEVLGFGARKYAPGNWAKCASRNRYVAAALRHLLAWQSGEDRDPESGLSHLAHAACSVLFALEMEVRGWGAPDRLQGPEVKP
jgi:hypothetical protein